MFGYAVQPPTPLFKIDIQPSLGDFHGWSKLPLAEVLSHLSALTLIYYNIYRHVQDLRIYSGLNRVLV